MSANVRQVRTAIVAAIESDATLQALMGRPSDLVRAWVDTGDAQLPMIAYQLLPFEQSRVIGNTWYGSVQVTAFADNVTSADPQALLEDIMERLVDLLNYNAFASAGLDAASMVMRRIDIVEDREETRGVYRTDLEIDLTLYHT